MSTRRFGLIFALLATTMLAPGCTSRDQKAATAAAIAADAMQGGQIAVARVQIGRALAIRDDVSEYWLLLGQVAIAQQDYAGAFNAYENVVTLDRGNIEALTRLCQIALNGDAPVRAERYADQLALLRPADNLPKTVKAMAALTRGDKPTTRRMLDEILSSDPDNSLALLGKSRLLTLDDDYAGAARAVEASLAAPGDPGGRLAMLKTIYVKSKDASGYARTVARIARAYPDSAPVQMDYAAVLFDAGDRSSGWAVAKRVLTLRPDDIALAGDILNLLLDQSADATTTGAILANAAGASLQGKAVYAQYANEIGRPDLAMTILEDVPTAGRPTAADSNARAARAYALALRGDRAAASTALAAILAVDPRQPGALLARARLRRVVGDLGGALQDARQAVSDDRGDATARLLLAELLLQQDEPVLAEKTLRDGLNGERAQPRIAMRLAAFLNTHGRRADAIAALTDHARANPVSRQAQKLLARFT